MNIRETILNTAIETLLSTLIPIKGILYTNKVPQSIWEDYYLLGYQITIMTKGLDLMSKETGEEISFDDFKYIIQKADPDNANFVINKFENIDSTSDKDGKELNRGEAIAEKALYLFYGEDSSLFPHIDSNDPIIIEAKRKAPTMGDILKSMSPNNVDVRNMDLNQMAAMSINHEYIFGYVKKNISKFTETQENPSSFKQRQDDSWTNKNNDRSYKSQKKEYDPREKVTLRDVFKSSSKIFGKGAKEGFKYAKKGFNKALDADLREVGQKTEEVAEKVAEKVVDGTGKLAKGIFELIFDFIKTVIVWSFWGLVIFALYLLIALFLKNYG